jgi:lysophospholipase L1-like esterase
LKTRSSELSSLGVSLLAVIVAVTCAAGERSSAPPSSRPAASAAPVSSAPRASSAPVVDPDAGGVPDAGPPGPRPPASQQPLARFHRALAELRKGERKSPVRALWLGDSHTAADWWPNGVRKPLQKRFGNGGPGFVHLGLEPYRHAGVQATVSGKWRHEPSSPAGSMKQLDAVFGLGGRRVVPSSADAGVSVQLLPDAVAGKARWNLAYRTPGKDDRLRVALSGEPVRYADSKQGRQPSGSSIRHLELESSGSAKLEVGVSGGAPELFGVVIESETPGFVLDTLGISGARAATALAWDAAAWQAEARDRAPVLFVLAYGTNEAASTSPVSRYEETLESLVGRVRGAAPEADCLLVGPPDMAAVGGGSVPRVLEHDAAARAVAERTGCAYFSSFDAMGGEGSFARWMKERPPLAAPDRVHLQPGGYEKLGQAIAEALLAGFTEP